MYSPKLCHSTGLERRWIKSIEDYNILCGVTRKNTENTVFHRKKIHLLTLLWTGQKKVIVWCAWKFTFWFRFGWNKNGGRSTVKKSIWKRKTKSNSFIFYLPLLASADPHIMVWKLFTGIGRDTHGVNCVCANGETNNATNACNFQNVKRNWSREANIQYFAFFFFLRIFGMPFHFISRWIYASNQRWKKNSLNWSVGEILKVIPNHHNQSPIFDDKTIGIKNSNEKKKRSKQILFRMNLWGTRAAKSENYS